MEYNEIDMFSRFSWYVYFDDKIDIVHCNTEFAKKYY